MKPWVAPMLVMFFTWAMTVWDFHRVRNQPPASQRAAKRLFILRSSTLSVMVWIAYYVFTYTTLAGHP